MKGSFENPSLQSFLLAPFPTLFLTILSMVPSQYSILNGLLKIFFSMVSSQWSSQYSLQFSFSEENVWLAFFSFSRSVLYTIVLYGYGISIPSLSKRFLIASLISHPEPYAMLLSLNQTSRRRFTAKSPSSVTCHFNFSSFPEIRVHGMKHR